MIHHGLQRNDSSGVDQAPKHPEDSIQKIEDDFRALQFRPQLKAVDHRVATDLEASALARYTAEGQKIEL